MKDKKGTTITNAFQKNLILKRSNRKPNKIWLDKGCEFCNRLMKSRIKENDIETYLIHNERKFVIERFIRTLKDKNCRYLTSISKNVCILISEMI